MSIPSPRPVTSWHGAEPDRSTAERQVLVQWCIDIADRLQEREPALAARLQRGLAAVGVNARRPDGEPFDGTLFDAVGCESTCRAEKDRTVARTHLVGYTDGDTVLRRPEVVVYRLEAVDGVR